MKKTEKKLLKKVAKLEKRLAKWQKYAGELDFELELMRRLSGSFARLLDEKDAEIAELRDKLRREIEEHCCFMDELEAAMKQADEDVKAEMETQAAFDAEIDAEMTAWLADTGKDETGQEPEQEQDKEGAA